MIELLLSLCSGYTVFLFFCGFEMIFVQIWTLDTRDLRALHHSGLLWFNSFELLRWAVWTRSKDSRGGGDYLYIKKKKWPNFDDRNVLNIEKKKSSGQRWKYTWKVAVKVKVPLIIKWLLCILLIGSGSDEWQRECSAAESLGDLISAPCPTLDGECLPVSRRPLCHEASQLVKCKVQQSLTGLLTFIAVIPYCKSDIQGRCHKQWAVAANFCSNIVHNNRHHFSAAFTKVFCPNGDVGKNGTWVIVGCVEREECYGKEKK